MITVDDLENLYLHQLNTASDALALAVKTMNAALNGNPDPDTEQIIRASTALSSAITARQTALDAYAHRFFEVDQ